MPNAGLRPARAGYRGATMYPRNPVWLTVEETAGHLGLSLAKVYEAIASGRLPAQRYGRSYLVRRSDVDEYSAQHAAAAR